MGLMTSTFLKLKFLLTLNKQKKGRFCFAHPKHEIQKVAGKNLPKKGLRLASAINLSRQNVKI
jgi:hypothetical protein